MKRIVFVLAAVALAGPTRAADAPPPASSSTTSSAPQGSSKLSPAKGAKPAPPAKISESDQRLLDVTYAKNKFMAAMGSCPKPEDCDPASPRKNAELVNLLQGAEDAFMQACAQCATDKACEQERDKIRSGRGRFGYNVCVATSGKSGATGKTGSTTSSEKKPATAKPAPAPVPSK